MRKPDLTIGPEHDPQTLRWHLIRGCPGQLLPRWLRLFVYRRKWMRHRRHSWQFSLHRWCRSDSDRALHDHTADNVSILLNGCYREWFSHAWEPARYRLRIPFVPYFRKAETPHRVELHRGAPIWSIWIRWPTRRKWGFHCPKGWRHWKEYVAEREDYYKTGISTVGRSCDD